MSSDMLSNFGDNEPKSQNSFSKYYYRRSSQSYRFDCSRFIPLRAKVLLRALQGTKGYIFLVIICTFYSLFAFDFNLWILPPAADDYIMIGNIIVLCFFIIDMVICVMSKPKYPLSHWFWLDLITILSLILEVVYYNIVDTSFSVGSLTRATRAAKLGSRIGRLMRLSKVLMGYWERRQMRKQGITPDKRQIHSSKVRKKFYQIIIFKVVLLVCALQIVVSLLGSAAYATNVGSGDLSLFILRKLSPLNSTSPQFISYVEDYVDVESEALLVQVNGETIFDRSQGVRRSSILLVSHSDNTFAYLDNSLFTKTEAGYDLLLTIIVLFVLYICVWSFQRDVAKYFLQPVERMVSIIESVTKMQVFAGESENETLFLEDILSKMTALLRVGLGDAGTRIIALNLSRAGTLDPMIPGKKVRAVFLFCDLRNFSKAAEGLQEDVLVFVNHIAHIVHSAATSNGGAPNKNIGDAFLLVWKLDAKENVADKAYLAYREIRANMKRNEDLQRLIRRYVDMGKLPASYRVKLGFGFHIGWAIEGAIGSIHKVDASYLSEHVNLTSRFESATKQYATDAIFSQDFYIALSPIYQRVCRAIDRVKVRGSSTPLTIYSTLPRSGNGGKALPAYPSINTLSDSVAGSLLDKNTQAHKEHFERGLNQYLDGNWLAAQISLEEAQRCVPGDGPTETLLQFIQSYEYIAPIDWPGHRTLVEK